MAPLLTTGQSRWALHGLLAVLSGVAIASSASPSVGGELMLRGRRGDVRGVQVLLGGCSLASTLVLRTAYVFVPKPWRVYLDRLEFTVISMIWIAWTSDTLAFSAFTIGRGVCEITLSDTILPTCSFLTFDLIILHLLSITSLALCLVVISTALSPSYWLAHSSLTNDEQRAEDDPELTDAFVMWDLALASPPSSPRTRPLPNLSQTKTYGTTEISTVDQFDHATRPDAATTTQRPKWDKFAERRVWSYVPLSLCSALACIACIWSLRDSPSKYAGATVFPLVAASVSLAFAVTFLIRHFTQMRKQVDGESFVSRHARALEVSLAGMLFLLWPLAAIVVTLFPPTLNRPCSNPAASLTSPPTGELPSVRINTLCIRTTLTVTVAWMASWIILARVMGLIVPMPEMRSDSTVRSRSLVDRGAEGQSLLHSKPVDPEPVERPQVKWGRMVAGEMFELGDEEDDE